MFIKDKVEVEMIFNVDVTPLILKVILLSSIGVIVNNEMIDCHADWTPFTRVEKRLVDEEMREFSVMMVVVDNIPFTFVCRVLVEIFNNIFVVVEIKSDNEVVEIIPLIFVVINLVVVEYEMVEVEMRVDVEIIPFTSDDKRLLFKDIV